MKEKPVLEYLHHLEDLQFRREKRAAESDARKKKKQTPIRNVVHDQAEVLSVEEEENEAEGSEESNSSSVDNSEADFSEDEDDHVILNEIDGSDDDDYAAIHIPKLKTVTQHGRVAGTWQRNFFLASDDGESNESEPDSNDERSTGNSDSDSDSDTDTKEMDSSTIDKDKQMENHLMENHRTSSFGRRIFKPKR